MIDKCTAFVHTDDKKWYAYCHDIVRQTGFSECRSFGDIAPRLVMFRRGPVPFLFLHSATPEVKLKRAISAIRKHDEILLRFSPIIMISETAEPMKLINFIQLGCDDIILHPCTAGQLASRLTMQIDRPLDYYQTETYFGPDRRKNEKSAVNHGMRGKGDYFYRRFVIQRDAKRGTTIVSSETHMPRMQTMAAG